MGKKIEDLEIKWAMQLVKEHKRICWYHKVNLTTPTINISSGTHTIGYWAPGNKTLSISRNLIKTEIWDIVIEVLRHEMAHQYVTEYNNDADGHGEHFKVACKKLGVHPAFIRSKGYDGKLDDFKGQLPPAAQKMLRKVEKLLALGQSNNEAEAQAASRKANYLLAKYNLERVEDGDADIKYQTICHGKKRIESIQRAILNILEEYYFVSCVTSYTYNPQDDSEFKSIVLIGKEEAIKVAEYVYHFLFDTAQNLWQKFKQQSKAGRGEKVSFDMGFIKGIEHNHKIMLEGVSIKMNSDRSLPVKTIKSLIERNKMMNRVEVSRLFPKLITSYYGSHQASSEAFKEGFKNGKNTHVRKSMTSRGTGISGLLTQ